MIQGEFVDFTLACVTFCKHYRSSSTQNVLDLFTSI